MMFCGAAKVAHPQRGFVLGGAAEVAHPRHVT